MSTERVINEADELEALLDNGVTAQAHLEVSVEKEVTEIGVFYAASIHGGHDKHLSRRRDHAVAYALQAEAKRLLSDEAATFPPTSVDE